MFCNKCGNQVKDGAQFCNVCGNKIKSPAKATSQPIQGTSQNQSQPAYQGQAQVAQSDGKKGLVLGLSICIAVIIVAIAIVLIFMFFGDKIFPQENKSTEVKTEQSDSDNSNQKNNNTKKDEDYLIVDSNTRYLTDAQVQGLSTYDLYIARNEIYARHGRDFKKADLKQYFASKSWYHVQYTPEYFDANTSTLLNDYERKNAEKMLAVEKSRNSPYLAP